MESIKGRRLTDRESLDMVAQDPDIPVIPPLRIKLEPVGPVTKSWLDYHANEGDYVIDKNDVRCIECKHLMFSDCYGECSKAFKGIVRPDDSCGKGERKDDEFKEG